ncbi:stage antigen [Plasmodium vivax Mauritania I]|uniref:Stage antigen n=1 Tax=Plasmodium vivax Mauritania I TaxID=1035515 RepID=A0A0J9VZA7_PLAVI|nr:stage antigen [Plasmodium vivax Mauritania I]
MSSFWSFIKSKKNDDEPKPTVAHLGEENKFYFNKELKRWVIRGEEDKVESEEKVTAPPKMSSLQNANQGYRSLMQQNKTRSARTIYAEIPGLKTIKKKSMQVQGGIVSPYMMDSAKNELSSNTTDENRSEPFGSNMFIPSVKVQEKTHVGGKSPPLAKNAGDAELEDHPKLGAKEEGEIIKGTADQKSAIETGVNDKAAEALPSGGGLMKRDSADLLKQLNGKNSKQESNLRSAEKSLFIPKTHMSSESVGNLPRESLPNSNRSNDRGGPMQESYVGIGASSESIPKGLELKGSFDSFNRPSGVNIPPKEVRSDHTVNSIKREDQSSSFYGDTGLGFSEGKGVPPLSGLPPPSGTPPLSRGPPPVAPPTGGPPPGGAVKPVYFERLERGGAKFATMPNGTYNGRAMEGSQTRAPPVMGANGRMDSWTKSNDDISRSIPVRPPPPSMFPTKTMAEGVSEQKEKALPMSGNYPGGFLPQKEKELIEHILSALKKGLTKEDEAFKGRLKLEAEKLHLAAEKESALDALYRKMSQLKSIKEESEGAEAVTASQLDEEGSATQGGEAEGEEEQSEVHNMLHLINSKNKKIKREVETFAHFCNELRRAKAKNEETIRLYKKREKKNLEILREMEEKERRRSASFKKKEKQYQEEILEGKRNLQLEIMNREEELQRATREREASLKVKEEELERAMREKEAALKEELKKVESEAERKVAVLEEELETRRAQEMEQLGGEQREVTRGELRAELRNEVVAELRGELKGEVMEELRGELRNEVVTELRGELKDGVITDLRTELKEEVAAELRTQLKDEAAGDLEKAKKLAEDNFNSKLEKYKEKMEENKNDFIKNLIVEKNGEVEALRCQLEKMKDEEICQLREEQQRALNENMEQMRQSLLEGEKQHQQHLEEVKRECELEKSREIEVLRGEVSRREEELEKQLSEEHEERLAQVEKQLSEEHEEKFSQMESSYKEKLAQMESSHEEKLAQLRREINQMAKEKRHLELNIALLKEEKENAINRSQNLEDNLRNSEEIHNRRVNLLQEQKEKLEKEIKEVIENRRKESEQIREKFGDLLQAEINRIKKESEQKVHTYVKQYEEMSEEYETKKKEFSDLLEKANSNNKNLNKKYEENIIKINEYEGMIKMLENQTEELVRKKIEELNDEFEKKKEIFEKEKKDLLQNCMQLEESHKKMKQQLEEEINLAMQENEQNIVRITNTYESRVHEMERRCELLMSQCSELKMRNDEMMEGFCREKAQRERSMERLSSVNDELTTKNNQLATKNDQLVTQNDQLATQNDQLTFKNDQLSDNLNEVKHELTSLQGKYEQVASQNAHLKSSEKEQRKLSHRLSDLETINRDLIRVTEKERELNIKNVSIIKSLQAQIKEQTSLYKEYTDELKDEIEKLKRVTESESNLSLSQLFNENKKLKLQNEEIATKSETMSAALDSLTKRLSFIEASIRDQDYGQEVIRRADELH